MQSWTHDHNEQVAAVLGALERAAQGLERASVAAHALARDSLTAKNTEQWTLDKAAEVRTQIRIVRSMLI